MRRACGWSGLSSWTTWSRSGADRGSSTVGAAPIAASVGRAMTLGGNADGERSTSAGPTSSWSRRSRGSGAPTTAWSPLRSHGLATEPVTPWRSSSWRRGARSRCRRVRRQRCCAPAGGPSERSSSAWHPSSTTRRCSRGCGGSGSTRSAIGATTATCLSSSTMTGAAWCMPQMVRATRLSERSSSSSARRDPQRSPMCRLMALPGSQGSSRSVARPRPCARTRSTSSNGRSLHSTKSDARPGMTCAFVGRVVPLGREGRKVRASG